MDRKEAEKFPFAIPPQSSYMSLTITSREEGSIGSPQAIDKSQRKKENMPQ